MNTELNEKDLEEAMSETENQEDHFKVAFIANKKDAMHQIAIYLIQKHNIKTIRGIKSRELFIYKDGIYTPNEDILKRDIRIMLEEQSTTHFIKEIIDAIKDLTAIDRNNFEVNPDLINFNNGVFDIKTGELKGHDPKYLFLTKFPINYDKDARFPKIKKFLSQTLSPEDILIIQEWFGYVLYRVYFLKKAIIFVGEGDTGKTTLLNLLIKFIGIENVSGVSLQKISSDKFAAAHFHNKHVNIYDDLSSNDVNDNGAFKIATGGGLITGERKFGDQFQFQNYSKLTFACNEIPDVKNVGDEAYFSRWIIVHFRNEVAKPDKFLITKITKEQELSGLLNFALKGLKRLIKKHDFSYSKESHEIKTEMQLAGSVLANFAKDCLEISLGDFISKDEMYESAAKYARSKHLTPPSKTILGRKLRNYADYIDDGKRSKINPETGKPGQITGWINVKFKLTDTPEEDVNALLAEIPSEQELQETIEQAPLSDLS